MQTVIHNQSTTEYTVKKGDSLWLIARRFDIHVTDLLEWNNLKKNRYLKPGQTLKINKDTKDQKDNVVQTVIHNQSTTEYTVKKGDSLWLIARRFDIHVTDLLEWNNLKKNRHLKPGQTLIIKKNFTGA